MQKYTRPVLVIIAMLLTTPVIADTHIITQQHKKFSDMFVKMENDDVLKFVNLDSVKHRLIFTHKGRQEQLHSIEPGKEQEITLHDSGIYDIQCKHHPSMKLTVYVPHVVKMTKNMANYQF